MSSYPILPINDISVEIDHSVEVQGIVHSFGSIYEQRIITDLPIGPRADGRNSQSTYVGRNIFNMTFPSLLHPTQPVTGNANLNNSVWKLWAFFHDLFYDSSTGSIGWSPFFVYLASENDAFLTWTGDVASGPIANSRGENCYEYSGRYLVRLASPVLSVAQFKFCLFSSGLEMLEVAE